MKSLLFLSATLLLTSAPLAGCSQTREAAHMGLGAFANQNMHNGQTDRRMDQAYFPMAHVVGVEVAGAIRAHLEKLPSDTAVDQQLIVVATGKGMVAFSTLMNSWECESAYGYIWRKGEERIEVRLKQKSLAAMCGDKILANLETVVSERIYQTLVMTGDTVGESLANEETWNRIGGSVAQAMSGWICTYIRGQGMFWYNPDTKEIGDPCFPG